MVARTRQIARHKDNCSLVFRHALADGKQVYDRQSGFRMDGALEAAQLFEGLELFEDEQEDEQGMNGHSREWVQFAVEDLNIAEKLDADPSAGFRFSVWLAREATEKALKGVLTFGQLDFPFTHKITQLIEILEKSGQQFPEEARDIAVLEMFPKLDRYPAPDPVALNEEITRRALRTAQATCAWATEIVEYPESRGPLRPL